MIAGDMHVLLEHAESGTGYCITSKAISEYFGGDIGNVPMPKCPHIVIYDDITGNHLVFRLADGETSIDAMDRMLAPLKHHFERIDGPVTFDDCGVALSRAMSKT